MAEAITYNIESEQAVLGALLARNNSFHRVNDILLESHFYEPLHAGLYAIIEDCIGKNQLASPITLMAVAATLPRIEDVGGTAYLARLAGLGASILDIRHFAQTVIAAHSRREMLALSEQLKYEAENSTKTESEIWALVSGTAIDMQERGASRRIISAAKVIANTIEKMGEDLPCTSTGLPSLDKAMGGGMYAKRTYGFTARPKQGKTTLLSTIADYVGKTMTPCLFIAAEMGQEEIQQRNTAADIGRGSLAFMESRKESKFNRDILAHQRNFKSALHYYDAPGITFQELKTTIIGGIRRYGIKGIFLDYFQLVEGREKGESEASHLAKVAQWIANIAKQESIWIAYAGQLNRNDEVYGSDGALKALDQLYSVEKEDLPEGDRSGKIPILLTMDATRYTPMLDVKDLYIWHHGPCVRDFQVDYNRPLLQSWHEPEAVVV